MLGKYDERQRQAQGDAFRYGFFTLIVAEGLQAALSSWLEAWYETSVICAVCICLGVTVFAVTCILKDAYVSLNERPGRYIIIFTALSALNLFIGVSHILLGTMLEAGRVSFRATNLIVGVMSAIILAVYVVKRLAGRRESEE